MEKLTQYQSIENILLTLPLLIKNVEENCEKMKEYIKYLEENKLVKSSKEKGKEKLRESIQRTEILLQEIPRINEKRKEIKGILEETIIIIKNMTEQFNGVIVNIQQDINVDDLNKQLEENINGDESRETRINISNALQRKQEISEEFKELEKKRITDFLKHEINKQPKEEYKPRPIYKHFED